MVVTTNAVVLGSELKGIAEKTVSVDTRAPAISGTTGNNATFYPIKDGVGDNFSPKTHVDEGGTLWLYVYSASSGTVLRIIGKNHTNSGTFTITWDGKASNGKLLPPGTYKYAFVAQDLAGNRRTGSKFTVFASPKRLVTRSAVLYREGDQAYAAGGSDESCAGAFTDESFYPRGIWLANACSSNFEIAGAFYELALPGAVSYTGIKLESYGFTIVPPVALDAAVYNFSHSEWDVMGSPHLTNSDERYSYFGTVSGSGRVSGGKVRFNVSVDNSLGISDYDLRNIRVTVSYQVLA
jgi:hypothetical protein